MSEKLEDGTGQGGAVRPPNCGAPSVCAPRLQVVDMARQLGPQFYCLGCLRYVHAGDDSAESDFDEWEEAAVDALVKYFSDEGMGTTYRHADVVACDVPAVAVARVRN